MRTLSHAVFLSPFVWVAVTLSAMAGTITLGDQSSSSNSDEVLVVESATDQDGNPVDVPIDFLSGPTTTQASNGFWDIIFGWVNDPDLVIVPAEVTPPVVEEGTETGVLVTPDLLPTHHAIVPEPSGLVLAAAGLLCAVFLVHWFDVIKRARSK